MLLRQVVLVLDSDERPVEFGAIRIQLNQLPPEARQRVLEGKLPLGRVLQDFFIQHSSRPVAYFEVEGRCADWRGTSDTKVRSDSTDGGTGC